MSFTLTVTSAPSGTPKNWPRIGRPGLPSSPVSPVPSIEHLLVLAAADLVGRERGQRERQAEAQVVLVTLEHVALGLRHRHAPAAAAASAGEGQQRHVRRERVGLELAAARTSWWARGP